MFTLVDAGGSARDLAGEWSGPATLAHLLSAAKVELPYSGAAVWVDGHSVSPDQPLASAGVVDGAVVSLAYSAAVAPSDPAADLHLAVVGGPGAGRLVSLGAGRHVLGRAPECDVRVADRAVSGRHFAIDVDSSGAATVEDLGSSHGTTVDGQRIRDRVPVAPGQLVVAGESFLELRRGAGADAVLHRTGDGFELRRPPRLRPAEMTAEIDWPVEPAPPGSHNLPLASALVPLAMGGVLFAVTKQALMLLFMLMSPVLAVTSTVTDRRSGKTRYRAEMDAYRDGVVVAEAEVAKALEAEAAVRRAAHPDPASVAATAAGPRRRLWERRRDDPDFAEMRVGLATLPSTVRRRSSGPYASDLDPIEVSAVPCVLSLTETGVTGVAGPPSIAPGVAAWLVAQTVCMSGPADLRVVVLSGDSPDPEQRWGWTKWLPHVAPASPGAAPGIGTTRPTIETRTRELVELIDQRQRARDSHRGRQGDVPWPAVLVVLDPAHDLRRVPGVDTVLQRGPSVGVVALCVEDSEGYLPVECRAVVVSDDSGRGVVRRSGQPDTAVALDRVDPAWCQILGRRLAPLRDPEVQTVGGSIPAAVRLVDLLGLDHIGADEVVQAWNRRGRSTAAAVGVGIDGPVIVDLVRDGPHGLVAGTTGAGKSEFLQTLVASLAVANRPDALTFLLIDYKGGSAFRDCARLPHTVGVVTDLDGHLTQRALTSLSAELKRREALLARGGAKDIDDYVTLGEPAGPMPRLVLVIDEFAGLVSELPDFVTGLVGIAQRGRSLGIHLILATQRPSGVVSPEIRANTNLRVALRVTSPAESVDIIDAPDAAMIASGTPGRAYALTGHSSLSLFQSARVGGPAAPTGAQGPEVALAAFGWAQAGRAAALEPGGASGADPADTDLARLVSALVDAAQAAGLPRQPQPWLDPLPEVLPLAILAAPALIAVGEVQAVPLGLVDLPAAQDQRPLVYHLPTARHLLVGGSPGSGRTTFLRTLAAALAGSHNPDDVWIHAVDCGGGELRRLAGLPHCGAVVTRNEVDRTDRLLARLRREMDRRGDLLAMGGFTDLAEQRAAVPAADRLPYMVVLIDRWEGFMSAFDPLDAGRLVDTVLDLAREGGSVGIRLVITGDRSVLLGKLAGMVEDRLCLNLAERADYSLAGLDARRVPPNMGPGRAVRSDDQAEVQIAVPGDSASGAAQTAALADLVQRWQGDASKTGADRRLGRAFRVDPLPARASMEEVASTVRDRPACATWALLGVGGDELAAVGVDLSESGSGFVVTGPRRSGRSTALVVMATSLLEGGSALIALCPRNSPLRALRGRKGVLGMLDGEDPPVAELLELLNRAAGPLAVMIDDANLVHNSSAAELLERVARDGPEQGHAMIIAGTPDDLLRPMRGFIVEVRQSRSGLLLCPESHLHAEVIGARLPRSAVFNQPPGRGILISDAGQLLVQVALPADSPQSAT
ncbi:MAG TPA: FtsK/SpoIIIE domain-containing protein [Acidimicrobiales bacterium]|jgi:S-DNA-T family DNA segregation ATPase FtsK/SpoIIIE|nr:FtsK/SpoIIIE domain-containing protein [Acidimicrobiales bacterium]